jgi:hypothetical protein
MLIWLELALGATNRHRARANFNSQATFRFGSRPLPGLARPGGRSWGQPVSNIRGAFFDRRLCNARCFLPRPD